MAWVTTFAFAFLFYFRQKLPYENGRYFDTESNVVIKEQSMIAIGFFGACLFVFSLYLSLRLLLYSKGKN